MLKNNVFQLLSSSKSEFLSIGHLKLGILSFQEYMNTEQIFYHQRESSREKLMAKFHEVP